MSAPLVSLLECIEPYDGTGDVVGWLRRLEDIAASQGVDSLEKHVPRLLTEGAYAVYTKIPTADQLSWDKVKQALLAAFSLSCFEAFEQLVGRRLGEGESVYVYLADIERLVSLVAGEWLKCAFLAGLPESVRAQLRAQLRAACDLNAMPMHKVVASARAVLQSMSAARESAEVRFAVGSSARKQRPPVLCYLCGRPDHIRRFCPQRGYCAAANSSGNSAAESRSSLCAAVRHCFVCGDTSHLAAACPDRRILPND